MLQMHLLDVDPVYNDHSKPNKYSIQWQQMLRTKYNKKAFPLKVKAELTPPFWGGASGHLDIYEPLAVHF